MTALPGAQSAPRLRKRTVFEPCAAHASDYACESRYRRAETFVEGGWPSLCAPQKCRMRPGLDFYTREFVAAHLVYEVENEY